MLSIEGIRSAMNDEPNQNDDKAASSFKNLGLDDAAFEVFFKEHFIPLCTYCGYKFDFDPDVAKEASHRAFIRLWENRMTILPGLPVKAYLYKIATNICLDILKHEKVKQQHEAYVAHLTPQGSFSPDYESLDYKELKQDIDKAVLDLPEQMRIVFELSRYEGLKYMEIAKRLGISVKTVETQMSRALGKLRQKLAQYLTIFIIIYLGGV